MNPRISKLLPCFGLPNVSQPVKATTASLLIIGLMKMRCRNFELDKCL